MEDLKNMALKEFIKIRDFRNYLIEKLSYTDFCIKIKSKEELIDVIEGIVKSYIYIQYKKIYESGDIAAFNPQNFCSLTDLKYPEFAIRFGLRELTSDPDRVKNMVDSVIRSYIFRRICRLKKLLKIWEAQL